MLLNVLEVVTLDDIYAHVCLRNMNIKVLNLLLNRYKCGLNESRCNSNQKWNYNECPCECKELDD